MPEYKLAAYTIELALTYFPVVVECQEKDEEIRIGTLHHRAGITKYRADYHAGHGTRTLRELLEELGMPDLTSFVIKAASGKPEQFADDPEGCKRARAQVRAYDWESAKSALHAHAAHKLESLAAARQPRASSRAKEGNQRKSSFETRAKGPRQREEEARKTAIVFLQENRANLPAGIGHLDHCRKVISLILAGKSAADAFSEVVRTMPAPHGSV